MISFQRPVKRIYFLKPIGMEGPIKVGCSHVVEERLQTFMNWSPFPLEILCQIDGGHEVERALHRRYRDARKHSEWFDPSPLMLSDISFLNTGGKVSNIVGDGPEIERRKKQDGRLKRVDPRFIAARSFEGREATS
jgi:hypothetical protein